MRLRVRFPVERRVGLRAVHFGQLTEFRFGLLPAPFVERFLAVVIQFRLAVRPLLFAVAFFLFPVVQFLLVIALLLLSVEPLLFAFLLAAFAAHGGKVADTQGDSYFVAFGTANDAVAAAVDAQRDLTAHAWPEGAQVKVRMGLHTGEQNPPRLDPPLNCIKLRWRHFARTVGDFQKGALEFVQRTGQHRVSLLQSCLAIQAVLAQQIFRALLLGGDVNGLLAARIGFRVREFDENHLRAIQMVAHGDEEDAFAHLCGIQRDARFGGPKVPAGEKCSHDHRCNHSRRGQAVFRPATAGVSCHPNISCSFTARTGRSGSP